MVTVVANTVTGELITPSKTKEGWGSVRVESNEIAVVNNIVQSQKRSALLKGKTEDLQALVIKDGQKLPGKIVHKESNTAFWPGQSPVMNPETQEVVMRNGLELYREPVYTPDTNATDVFITEKADVATPVAMAEQ